MVFLGRFHNRLICGWSKGISFAFWALDDDLNYNSFSSPEFNDEPSIQNGPRGLRKVEGWVLARRSMGGGQTIG